MKMVKAIPEGYHSVTPYLVVNDAVAAIDFYKRAFDAKESYRLQGPEGKSIIHAELKIGDSIVFLSDEFPPWRMHFAQVFRRKFCYITYLHRGCR
jgi:PhnB protein